MINNNILALLNKTPDAKNTINEHIKKLFNDGELQEVATIRNFRIVQTEGTREVSRDVKHYSF